MYASLMPAAGHASTRQFHSIRSIEWCLPPYRAYQHRMECGIIGIALDTSATPLPPSPAHVSSIPEVGVDGPAHALDDDKIGADGGVRQRVADPPQVQAGAALAAGHHV